MIAPSHSQIGGLVGKAFCEAGYTRFVEIIGPQDRIDVIHKHEAFARVLHQHGHKLSDTHILHADYNLKQATQQVLEHIELFQPGTACFAQKRYDGIRRAGSTARAGHSGAG